MRNLRRTDPIPESWPTTAMRMFFDEDKPLLEIFAALLPVTPAEIVGEIKGQIAVRCVRR